MWTPTVFKVPFTKSVPGALDEPFAAALAITRLTFLVLDVARVNVPKAKRQGQRSRGNQRARRRAGDIPHTVVGMKSAQVQGDFRTEVVQDPVAESLELLWGVVVTWNK